MTLWSKFYWNDWRADPGLRASSIAARGLWMECLCIAADSDPFGYVLINGKCPDFPTLARIAGMAEAEAQSLMAELDQNGVFSRDRKGRIYSRRMVRDAQKAATAKKNGHFGGNPTLSKETGIPPSVNPPDKPTVNTYESDTNSYEPEREGHDSDSNFAIWYSAYPRRVGRGAALRAYRIACKKTDHETLLSAARRFADQHAGSDPKFIPHPSTWLNGERWLDEPEQPRSPSPDGTGIPASGGGATGAYARWAARRGLA